MRGSPLQVQVVMMGERAERRGPEDGDTPNKEAVAVGDTVTVVGEANGGGTMAVGKAGDGALDPAAEIRTKGGNQVAELIEDGREMEVAARYEDAGKVNFKASINTAVERYRRCRGVLAAGGAANPRKDGTQIVDKNELVNLRKRRRWRRRPARGSRPRSSRSGGGAASRPAPANSVFKSAFLNSLF